MAKNSEEQVPLCHYQCMFLTSKVTRNFKRSTRLHCPWQQVHAHTKYKNMQAMFPCLPNTDKHISLHFRRKIDVNRFVFQPDSTSTYSSDVSLDFYLGLHLSGRGKGGLQHQASLGYHGIPAGSRVPRGNTTTMTTLALTTAARIYQGKTGFWFYVGWTAGWSG